VSVNGQTKVSLRTIYQPPLEVHVIRDWVSGHPRIVLPVLVFLLGTLTYTVAASLVSFVIRSNRGMAVIDI